MPEYLPVPVPDLEGKTKPQGTDLTEHQQKLVDQVLAHFSAEDYVVPGVEDGTLGEGEKYWLSYECMLRYLRGTKWVSAEAAIKRIEETLKWRREFGFYSLVTAEHVEPEAVTGKEILYNYDTDGRPALYLCPSRQNTPESDRQIHFTFWILERMIDLMGPGVETLDLMINFADRAKNPSLSTSRTVLNILQSHYPEHLGRAFIMNVPFLINAFFKLITPFVDPVTRPKMRFNPRVVEEGCFTPDTVWKEFGGDCEFVYEHEQYWPALIKLCSERREANMKEWRELGGKVGLREWDVRSGAASSVATAENGVLADAPVEEKASLATADSPIPAAEVQA